MWNKKTFTLKNPEIIVFLKAILSLFIFTFVKFMTFGVNFKILNWLLFYIVGYTPK